MERAWTDRQREARARIKKQTSAMMGGRRPKVPVRPMSDDEVRRAVAEFEARRGGAEKAEGPGL